MEFERIARQDPLWSVELRLRAFSGRAHHFKASLFQVFSFDCALIPLWTRTYDDVAYIFCLCPNCYLLPRLRNFSDSASGKTSWCQEVDCREEIALSSWFSNNFLEGCTRSACLIEALAEREGGSNQFSWFSRIKKMISQKDQIAWQIGMRGFKGIKH